MYAFSMTFVVTVIISGFTLNSGAWNFLKCDVDDSSKWHPTKLFGNFFGTFHVLAVVAATLQAERAFYSIPHDLGYFKRDKNDVYINARMDSEFSRRNTNIKRFVSRVSIAETLSQRKFQSSLKVSK